MRHDSQVEPDRFGPVHEALVRKYSNANMDPGRHATYLRLRALKHQWDVDAVLQQLQTLTLESLQVSFPPLRPEACCASRVLAMGQKTWMSRGVACK